MAIHHACCNWDGWRRERATLMSCPVCVIHRFSSFLVAGCFPWHSLVGLYYYRHLIDTQINYQDVLSSSRVSLADRDYQSMDGMTQIHHPDIRSHSLSFSGSNTYRLESNPLHFALAYCYYS